jgi:hypothetical protein
MARITELLAVGTEFEFEGEKFTYRKPRLIEQAQFSQWLKDDSKNEAGRGDVPEDVREGLYRAAMRDVGEKYYDPDSPGYVVALNRVVGMAKMLYLIFRNEKNADGNLAHPGFTEEKSHRLLQFALTQEYVKLVAAENKLDPKEMAGFLIGLGFPPDYLSSSGNSSSDSATPPTTSAPSESGT